MSTSIIPTNIKVPAHLANRLGTPSALGGALSGGISDAPVIPRISIKGGRFRIVEGSAEELLNTHTLQVIIVGANPNLSKTWYEKKWSVDNEPSAPDCYSLDGLKPAADATKPQSPNCATCTHNQWGSKISEQGQKIKACADQKRLAVVDATNPSGPIYLLTVTPAALKNLNHYDKELKRHAIPAEIAITNLSFDTNASFPKLQFSFGGFIDEPTQAVVDELFGSSTVTEVTGEAPLQAEVVLEVERPVLVKEKRQAVPQEVVVEVEPPVQEAAPPKSGGFGRGPKQEPERPAAQTQKQAAPKRAEPPVVTTSERLGAEVEDLIKGLDFDDELTAE